MSGASRPSCGSQASFSIVTRRAPGRVVVTVDGLVDAHNSGQLRYILSDLIDQQGNRNLVIDLRDTTVGEGADLELFVQAAHAARHALSRAAHRALERPSLRLYGERPRRDRRLDLLPEVRRDRRRPRLVPADEMVLERRRLRQLRRTDSGGV